MNINDVEDATKTAKTQTSAVDTGIVLCFCLCVCVCVEKKRAMAGLIPFFVNEHSKVKKERKKNMAAKDVVRHLHSSSSATKSALKTASAAAILQALVQAEGSAEAAAELVASGRVQDRFENDGDWGSVAREFGDSRFDQDALESIIDIAKDLYRKNPAKYDNNVWRAFSAARDANRMYEYNLYKLQKDTGLTWRAFEAKHHDDLKTSGVMPIIWQKYR